MISSSLRPRFLEKLNSPWRVNKSPVRNIKLDRRGSLTSKQSDDSSFNFPLVSIYPRASINWSNLNNRVFIGVLLK